MTQKNKEATQIQLINDRAVAAILSMSLPWVRHERYKRNKGQPHSLQIDPVYVGKSPRYRMVDILSWLESLRK